VFRNRVELMERDLQCVLDEKEDLIMSRDSYKAKTDRLNKRLNEIVRSQQRQFNIRKSDSDDRDHNETNVLDDHSTASGAFANKVLDIDSILTENRFLQERLQQLEDEKQQATTALSKYKTIFEKANGKKNILNSIGFTRKPGNDYSGGSEVTMGDLPSPSFDLNSISSNVISSKQVQQFISSNNLNNLEVSQNSIAQLRALLVALFEAFCDKSSALGLQKKNNKLLGKRIKELEDKIRELQAKEKVFLLMKEDSFFPGLSTTGGVGSDLDEDDGGQEEERSDFDDAVDTDSENRPTSEPESCESSIISSLTDQTAHLRCLKF